MSAAIPPGVGPSGPAGESEWLDAEAAARHLGLPTGFIYAMVNADQLLAVRFRVTALRANVWMSS